MFDGFDKRVLAKGVPSSLTFVQGCNAVIDVATKHLRHVSALVCRVLKRDVWRTLDSVRIPSEILLRNGEGIAIVEPQK